MTSLCFFHVHMSYKPQLQSSFDCQPAILKHVLTVYGTVLLLLQLFFYPSSTHNPDYVT